MKALVARALASRVKDGDVIGIGSGTTVEMAVDQIGQRIARDGISVAGVPTSYRIALKAEEAGIKVFSEISALKLDWAFDGADEVDPAFNMIKGRGGAMLSEKIVAMRAKDLVIIVTDEKLVDNLGTNFPVPVEVVPHAVHIAREGLEKLGASSVELREATNKYGPVVTEHNNLILDAKFSNISPELEKDINSLTGVVENGLFIDCTRELLIAREDGVWSRKLNNGKQEEEKVLDS